MATLNTPEQNGCLILKIFVGNFNLRPNDVLRVSNFMAVMTKLNLRAEDLNEGLEFATQNEWIEALENGSSYRLTEAGFTQA